jgi:hypothetical protein
MWKLRKVELIWEKRKEATAGWGGKERAKGEREVGQWATKYN